MQLPDTLSRVYLPEEESNKFEAEVTSVNMLDGLPVADALEDTNAKTVVKKFKMQFARYGIPDTCVSDNGPQFTSAEYKKFSREWKFEIITSISSLSKD